MTDYLAAIDLGSTSLKAAVFDADGRGVSSASRPTEQVRPGGAPPEWVVWDPEQIWGGAAAAMRDALSRLDDPRRLRAVAVTGMGMDGVPVDAKGNVLYPFISWHDPRTAPQAEWWRRNVGAERTFAITGFPVWPFMAAMRMLWMREHEPRILERADAWLLIEDFLNFRLCGTRATDFSMASCTQLFDQRRRAWSEELIAASGLPAGLLPKVKPSGTPLGAVHAAAAAATGIPEGTPVILGGQDHLCGTLPVGAHVPGNLLDVFGTWENVITAIPEAVLTEEVRRASVCVQAHVAPGVYAAWGGTMAGECLEWYRRAIGGGADLEQSLAELAGAPPGPGGVLFLPHLSGAACPVADPDSRGAFVGISQATTRADLLRAVLDGLNFQFLDILETLQRGLRTRFDRITAAGGGARSDVLIQAKADMTGLPVEVPEVKETTLLGAAMIAGMGAGVYPNLAEAVRRVKRPGRVFEPRRGLREAYAESFARYRALYPALRTVNPGLKNPSDSPSCGGAG